MAPPNFGRNTFHDTVVTMLGGGDDEKEEEPCHTTPDRPCANQSAFNGPQPQAPITLPCSWPRPETQIGPVQRPQPEPSKDLPPISGFESASSSSASPAAVQWTPVQWTPAPALGGGAGTFTTMPQSITNTDFGLHHCITAPAFGSGWLKDTEMSDAPFPWSSYDDTVMTDSSLTESTPMSTDDENDQESGSTVPALKLPSTIAAVEQIDVSLSDSEIRDVYRQSEKRKVREFEVLARSSPSLAGKKKRRSSHDERPWRLQAPVAFGVYR